MGAASIFPKLTIDIEFGGFIKVKGQGYIIKVLLIPEVKLHNFDIFNIDTFGN
jgi:hypothetical protein